jgi:outer membrane receptor for ferrienterochelin and colicins
MNLLKKLVFLLYFGVFALKSYSQTGSLEGKLRSGEEPTSDVLVYLEGTSYKCTSDSNGKFLIKEIKPGAYTLKTSSPAFRPLSKKILIKENEFLHLNLEMEELVSELEPVVITGTMKEVSKSSSPIPVEVYTPAYFKKNPTPNLFESLQMVNGVQPQLNCNVCNTGDIHINGMEGPYTMVTIDGMPIVSSLSTVYGLSGIPNSMVQRLEVVKGPASTLYGSEAVGGLINIITKDPVTSPKFTADIFGTSYHEFNGDFSFAKKYKQSSSLLGINYFNYTRPVDVNGDNFTDVTLQNRISIFNKWSLQRKSDRLASIAGRYIYEDRWGGEMQWKKEFRGGDSVYGESIFTSRYELIGVYQLPFEKEKFLLQFSFNKHNQNSVYGTTTYIAEQNISFIQLLWDKKINARHDLLAGLPLRYTYYDDNTPATQTADSINPLNLPQRTFLPGIFIQDEISISKNLSSLAGLRYDYNSDHGSIFSPRLSFKYYWNENNTFRLSGGNGYRVVNLFTEDHAALTGSRQVIIGESLKPERSWNVNFNYQRYLNLKKGFALLDASLFYTYFANKIVGDFLTSNDKIIYSNLDGHAVSRGITLNTELSFTFPMKVLLGGTFMNVYSMQRDSSEILQKVPQLHAPVFSGTFAITYKFSKLRTSVDFTGRVMGPMHLPVVENDFRPEKSPWFTIANIQITKAINKKWEVYGGIKNIFNFMPKDPLLRPFDPFDKNIGVNNPYGYTFDTTYNYAPIQRIRGFLGVRYVVN